MAFWLAQELMGADLLSYVLGIVTRLLTSMEMGMKMSAMKERVS